MVDCRTMLSALVAAYDQHRRWMMADKFAALQRTVDHARDVLAQSEPASASDGEVADLVTWLRREACFDSQWAASAWAPRLNRAADLLERQAAVAPVARLPEDAQVIEPANRIILAPVPTPIPVSERLPGPEDCQPWPDEPDADPWCWLGSNLFDGGWEWEQRSVQFLRHYGNEYTHWLPAHALPLPEVNHD